MKDISSVDYEKIANKIIKSQELIVGPIAWDQARKVSGLVVKDGSIQIQSEGKKVLGELVKQYESLFGQASVEICKEVIRKLADVDSKDLPPILH